MKLTMNRRRLDLALKNLSMVENNCNEVGSKFEPSLVVCQYLTEILIPITDIYDTSVLREVSFQTIFNNSTELGEYLDEIIQRLKRNEGYALTTVEIEELKESFEVNAHEFLIDTGLKPSGQLLNFLTSLLNKLKEIHDLLEDPRRNNVKVSYTKRILKLPLIYTVSVLEALSIGLANV